MFKRRGVEVKIGARLIHVSRPRGSRLTDAERDIIGRYYPLIVATAERAEERGIIIPDLVAELVLACVIAIPRYHPDRAGVATYLRIVMRSAIRDLLRFASRRPRLITNTGLENAMVARENDPKEWC